MPGNNMGISNQRFKRKLIVALLAVVAVGLVVVKRNTFSVDGMTRSHNSNGRSTRSDSSISGTSGSVFKGEKIRRFNFENLKTASLTSIEIKQNRMCKIWGVVTTIFEPTASMFKALEQPGMCLVVVADRKTPTTKYLDLEKKNERLSFLSVKQQEAMQHWEITDELPWNHFGRKNLGFLYAIQHGASVVFDFDDDNELTSAIPSPTDGPWQLAGSPGAFNPYPAFTHLDDVAWPRGFPLTQIQNSSTWRLSTKSGSSTPRLGVLQSLADHDPDMDAIWRLTRKLPLYFDAGKRIVLPCGTYSSYNAQATLHYAHALWGMLLPVSVHGRVSDIWRSYIMQRLMHDVGLSVGFVSPFVKQVRNAHNYQADFMSEGPLYAKTEALIRTISEWRSQCDRFENRFVELFIELYERDFLEVEDVHLAHKWIGTLKQMGIVFPQIQNTC